MKSKPQANQLGFTLLETMVASLILGMVITGVISMLGIGTALETENGLRRQARIINVSVLENSVNHGGNFNLIPLGSNTMDTALLTSAGIRIPATLTTTVTQATANWLNNEGGADVPVPYKTIKSKIQWTISDRTDADSIQKTISDIQ